MIIHFEASLKIRCQNKNMSADCWAHTLLLLAAPTWLMGRCGIHNYPLAISVMDFIMALISCLIKSIHLGFGIPRFLLRGGTIATVFLPTYSLSHLLTCPNYLNLAFLHLSVIFSTFSISLVSSFQAWSLSVWPHAHLHIFISVTSNVLTWELVIGTFFIPYSIAD